MMEIHHHAISASFFGHYSTKCFAVSTIIVNFANESYPCWKPSGQRGGADTYIITKAYLALWFWHSENFANSSVRQKQSNGDASWVYYTQPSLALCYRYWQQGWCKLLYIHTRGAFSVARFDEQGNAKAFRMWNERQDWLHVLFICMPDTSSF